MGYRGTDANKKAGTYSYRAIEVVLVTGATATVGEDSTVVLTVENDWETLTFLKENMDSIAANLVRMKQMDSERRKHVEESAELFGKNLEPLFSLISVISREHILDKLSLSLRKALLLMAMDRYNCDTDQICRALGISKAKLEKEMKRCGLLREGKKAA